MAITNTDMKVKPLAMLLRQINLDNNVALTEEQVQLRALTVLDPVEPQVIQVQGESYTINRNTSVELDILTDEVQDDFVKLKYQRISLAHLFSRITPSLFELDVLKEGELSPVDVWNALLAKYEILGNDTDFVLTANADKTQLTLVAKPENFAYTEQVVFIVDPSLSTRIPTKLLDGFEIPKGPSPSIFTMSDISEDVADAIAWYDVNDKFFAYSNGFDVMFVNKADGTVASKIVWADLPAYEGGMCRGKAIAVNTDNIYLIKYGFSTESMFELTVYTVDTSSSIATVTKVVHQTSTLSVNLMTMERSTLKFTMYNDKICTIVTGSDRKKYLMSQSPKTNLLDYIEILPTVTDGIIEAYSSGIGELIFITTANTYGYYNVETQKHYMSTKTWPTNDGATSDALQFNLTVSGNWVYHTKLLISGAEAHQLYALDVRSDTMKQIDLTPIFGMLGVDVPMAGTTRCVIDNEMFRYVIISDSDVTKCYNIPLDVLSTLPVK